jgi:hypothetical protein
LSRSGLDPDLYRRGRGAQRSDASEFYRLHTESVSVRRTHAGIIVALQQRFSGGEQLHRILHIRGTINAEGMRNRIEFLANWD